MASLLLDGPGAGFERDLERLLRHYPEQADAVRSWVAGVRSEGRMDDSDAAERDP